jgi:hypothetical protein
MEVRIERCSSISFSKNASPVRGAIRMISGNAIQWIAQARDKNIPTALMDSILEKFLRRLVSIIFNISFYAT